MRAENTALTERLAEWERRLGLNSGNSGKPPSSDGLKKPPRVRSLGEPSGKKTGGQTGHPGKTLCRAETPDTTIDHYPAVCAGCGEPSTAAMATDHRARQVFDLPEPKPLIVTEDRAAWVLLHGRWHTDAGAAPGRGHRAGAIRPADRGLCAVSAARPVAPRKRLADLCEVKLVTATIARISQD
jgi:transposase